MQPTNLQSEYYKDNVNEWHKFNSFGWPVAEILGPSECKLNYIHEIIWQMLAAMIIEWNCSFYRFQFFFFTDWRKTEICKMDNFIQ